MRGHLFAWLTLGALLATTLPLVPVTAQGGGLISEVSANDPHVGFPLVDVRLVAGFLDLDGDQQPDLSAPEEPFYLDADSDLAISFGDVRLTGAGHYEAGSLVNVTNWDRGDALVKSGGWFARTSSGSWFFDADRDRRISLGDIAFASSGGGVKVAMGDPAMGQSLTLVQEAFSESERGGFLDANENRQRDVGEPIVLDMDRSDTLTRGDILIDVGRLATDGPRDGTGPGEGPGSVDPQRVVALEADIDRLEREVRDLEDRIDALERAAGGGGGSGGDGTGGDNGDADDTSEANGATTDSPFLGGTWTAVALLAAVALQAIWYHNRPRR